MFEGFCGRRTDPPYHRTVSRTLPIIVCLIAGLTAYACSPLPLIQDATAVRRGKLKVGAGLAMGMPVDPETYFQPDGPGAIGPADSDLQYMPILHPFGWTRYGLGYDLEFTTAFHVPAFAVALGLKWAFVNYEPGNVVSAAVSGDVGASLAFPSLIAGLSLITSFHVSESVSLDVANRFGTMSALWDSPCLTSTLGVSIGRKSTVRLAVGYTLALGDDLIPGLPPSASAIYLGGGWEY